LLQAENATWMKAATQAITIFFMVCFLSVNYFFV